MNARSPTEMRPVSIDAPPPSTPILRSMSNSGGLLLLRPVGAAGAHPDRAVELGHAAHADRAVEVHVGAVERLGEGAVEQLGGLFLVVTAASGDEQAEGREDRCAEEAERAQRRAERSERTPAPTQLPAGPGVGSPDVPPLQELLASAPLAMLALAAPAQASAARRPGGRWPARTEGSDPFVPEEAGSRLPEPRGGARAAAAAPRAGTSATKRGARAVTPGHLPRPPRAQDLPLGGPQLRAHLLGRRCAPWAACAAAAGAS